MSQQDGFSSGFLLGAIVGGVVGGVVGALLTAKQLNPAPDSDEKDPETNTLESKPDKRKRLFGAGRNGVDMETARRSLENKIAQLNEAIDDVRQQLGNPNGEVPREIEERPVPPDPRG